MLAGRNGGRRLADNNSNNTFVGWKLFKDVEVVDLFTRDSLFKAEKWSWIDSDFSSLLTFFLSLK